MRDRLIEILLEDCVTFTDEYKVSARLQAERVADILLANGVIVPPCKVGQTCYKVWNGEILEIKVVSIVYEPLPAYSYEIRFNSIGVLCLLPDGSRNEKYSWNDIFLTREEAEAALAEREGKV